MRFLANENIPQKTIAYVQCNGIDIVSVGDIFPGACDAEVLRFAFDENRILVTFDKDFGEWAFRQKRQSHGIILLRFMLQDEGYVADKLFKLLNQKLPFLNNFTVVSESRIRMVNLP